MGRNNLDKFYIGLEELHLSLTEKQIHQFVRYYEMLTEWNERMNLTTITEWDDVVAKHFLDSLCLVKAVPDLKDQSVIDVGTGAGFPGIPLKIAFPELKMVLEDSVNKKLNFLNFAIGELGLTDAVTVHGRAEDMAHEEDFRGRFDVCVSRAVADLAVLAEYCLPFVRMGGLFAAYKSADADDECARAEKAVSLLGGGTERVIKYFLPVTGDGRSLICVKKIKGTPRAYPRKAGTPSANPL